MNEDVARKVRLHKYARIAVLNAPKGYEDTLGAGVSVSSDGAPFDCCLVFCFTLDEMTSAVKDAQEKARISAGGILLLAYPKTKNKRYPAIGRDDIFPAFGMDPDGDGRVPDTDFFFNLMVKLDATFTLIGLKNMAGETQRAPAKSQSAADYESFIPELESRLAAAPNLLEFYQSLAPGYKRGWARHVYSAVKKETQDKRFETMKTLLKKGIKSIDLA